MYYSVDELISLSGGALTHSPGFARLRLNQNLDRYESALVAKAVGESFTLTARGKLRLLFYVHAWGGTLAAAMSGEAEEVSLFSAETGFKSVAYDARGPIRFEIVDGAPKTGGNECWLVGVDFFERQDWTGLSFPASPICDLTYGVHGSFLTLSNDVAIGAEIRNKGVWAPNDIDVFRAHISAGMTVLDCGANIGHHSVVYSAIVGPSGRVIAIEPQRNLHGLACANVVINGCSNTEVIRYALGDKHGFVQMMAIDYSRRLNFGSFGLDHSTENNPSEGGEVVPLIELDKLLTVHYPDLTRVDFIKLDVQSYELFVLKGAVGTVRKFRPKLFLEIAPFGMYRKGYDYTDIYALLRSWGYRFDHLDGKEHPDDFVRMWSGRQDEEWDILAVPD